MRRNILYLLSIGICLFTCVGSHAAAPETRAHLERGRSLFDHGRWTDARYELLKAREGADRDDRLTLQQIDYQLAVCALKLGSRDAEAMLADFSKRYPESVYNNDLRFAQGLLYCSRSEYDKALACFGRVNYRALDRTRREQYDLRMGYIEFGRDDYDRAMTYFDRINPQSEFYDHALYYKSYIAYAREQYDWARSGFERLLKSEAYGEVAPYYLLQIEFKQGNYRYVVENGEELIRRHRPASGPNSRGSWPKRGFAWANIPNRWITSTLSCRPAEKWAGMKIISTDSPSTVRPATTMPQSICARRAEPTTL